MKFPAEINKSLSNPSYFDWERRLSITELIYHVINFVTNSKKLINPTGLL